LVYGRRFEFTFELAWKLIKALFEYKGTGEIMFPKDAFRKAFSVGFIEDDTIWLDMIKDRNLTSHTYDEKTSYEIYKHIKNLHYAHLAKLADDVKGELES
jgi:nucleotidyltransferase substrate binding protein (TIGR01987 family)